jgi:predicted TIM-barrel fold metal-dependent hydrolase
MTHECDGRVRPVGVLAGDDLDQLVAEVDQMLDEGVRAVLMAAGVPVAGMSPADARLDPLWARLAEADVPMLNHVGSERGLLASMAWATNVAEFLPSTNSMAEFPIEPWRSSTLHYATENFLTTMIMGGVFERHPSLRYGIAELQAHWIGPLADRLDMLVEQFARRYSDYSMLPSERIQRNVRVAPFIFEPVERYLELYPKMADVLCYSSDFPHREGGKESKRVLADRLAPLGPEVSEKFFVTNAELLLPA